MKYRQLLVAILISFVFVRCSKEHERKTIDVAGNWAFRHQFSQSFPFPSVMVNAPAVNTANWSLSSDSIRVNFDGKGNYTFSRFRSPAESGTYRIVRDSILVITPEASAFTKFCYSTPYVYASPAPNSTPVPDPNYHFISDSIYFKMSGDNIIFTAIWLNLTSTPIEPAMDTLLLTQASSTFTKLP